VVHEKLGDIDEALKYFRRYEQMDLDPKERARADANIKRLEGAGARHEVDKPPAQAETPPPPPPPPPPPAAPPAQPLAGPRPSTMTPDAYYFPLDPPARQPFAKLRK